VSEDFNKELESGKTVAKLMFYKIPKPEETVTPETNEEGEENDKANADEPNEEQNNEGEGEEVMEPDTDAIFGAAKVIYGFRPTKKEKGGGGGGEEEEEEEEEEQLLVIDPER
jgi:hypothetical protein